MKDRFKRFKLDESGIMMSEIIVAFAVLMICAGTLAVCVRFSSNMMMTAKDKDMEYTKFQEDTVNYFASDEIVKDASRDAYDVTPNGEINYTFAGALTMKMDTATVTVDERNIVIYSTANEK
ncbi:MAG: hypothetical protein K5656_12250 [Lachnospiraceae bacterium]|nr:hypothetical protein [Lachnospiraceae bacterium]